MTDTAAEIVARDQPNSSCSGSISTLGAARNDPAPTRATNATVATHHARWIGTRPLDDIVGTLAEFSPELTPDFRGRIVPLCDPGLDRVELARPTEPVHAAAWPRIAYRPRGGSAAPTSPRNSASGSCRVIRAVARERVGALGAAVLEVAERGQRADDRLVAGSPVEAGDERDAAGVVLVGRVVEADSLHSRSSRRRPLA